MKLTYTCHFGYLGSLWLRGVAAGPLRGSWWAARYATRLVAGHYVAIRLWRALRGSRRAATRLWRAATRLEASRYTAMAGRYAARGKPLRGYGGPLRGSRRAATRLWRAGRYGPQTTTRPPRGAATRHKYTIPVQSYFMKPRARRNTFGESSVLFASPPPSRRSRSECGALPVAPWRATELQVRTAYTRSSVPCRVLDHHPQPSARPRP
jgi:hypothetical protein